jgi:hypothetical protein
MNEESQERIRESKRKWARKRYDEDIEKARAISREKYRKKKEKMGEEVKPVGRPRKQKTIQESELSEKDRRRIYYYLDMIENEKDLPNIDTLTEDQKRCLMFAMLRELKRRRDIKKSSLNKE